MTGTIDTAFILIHIRLDKRKFLGITVRKIITIFLIVAISASLFAFFISKSILGFIIPFGVLCSSLFLALYWARTWPIALAMLKKAEKPDMWYIMSNYKKELMRYNTIRYYGQNFR